MRSWGWTQLADSGNYGQRVDANNVLIQQPNKRIWIAQLLHWTFVCVVPARFFCMGTVYLNRHWLVEIARAFSQLPAFQGRPRVELVVVMLVGPFTLNALQFLIQDYVLKGRTKGPGDEETPEETERLVGGDKTS